VVINNNGDPIKNAIIALELNGGVVRIKTNYEGKFGVYLSNKRIYRIYASDPNLEYFYIRESLKPPQNVEIKISNNFKSNSYVMNGNVTDYYDNSQIPGTYVLFYGEGITKTIILKKVKDKNGYFNIKTLSDKGIIFADAPGFSISRYDINLKSDQLNNINIKLRKGAVIVGEVKDKVTGIPITNADVTVMGKDWFEYQKNITNTNINGRYLLYGVETSDNILIVHANGYGYGYKQINVQEETESEIDFELEKSGKISGIIRDSNGNPLSNVEVILLSKPNSGSGVVNDNLSQQVTSDDYGYYSIDNVPPGKNALYFWPILLENYGILVSDPFDLSSGEEKEIDGQLNVLSNITIQVKSSKDNSPIANLQVTFAHMDSEGFYIPECLQQEDHDKYWIHKNTDSNGIVNFNGSALNYVLSIAHVLYIPYNQEIIVLPNEGEKWINVNLDEEDYAQYIQ